MINVIGVSQKYRTYALLFYVTINSVNTALSCEVSDHYKIDNAIRYAISSSPFIQVQIRNPDKTLSLNYYRVEYPTNIEQFKQLNPKCCNIGVIPGDGFNPISPRDQRERGPIITVLVDGEIFYRNEAKTLVSTRRVLQVNVDKCGTVIPGNP